MATKARRKKFVKHEFISNRTTPFDTGKVKIGVYYEQPMYVEHDKDMLEIQKWMIGDPVKLRRDYWINVAYIMALVFVLLVIILRG